MSIKEMLKEHPLDSGDHGDKLGEAVKHAMYGAAIMNACADACLAEADAEDRAECIRRCLDASDACTAFTRIASRRVGGHVRTIKAAGAAAIIACEECHALCKQHEDAHCQRCARMCEEVIRDAKAAVQGLVDSEAAS
ncbi:four-helix bundle copper-binding protein [Erythrobacter sp.]|uniref:four-helix bundle copper-binding protein n=1 Tax=Erythrobacter sp. TaxID=1042 RepID=UPI001425F9A6|nr:four-helix bundle copper-binding protein [Erythrobacter sp.]QIQ86764.1 MAG: four-helix bundle copper-binding protein [Erythrobacter sp.]